VDDPQKKQHEALKIHIVEHASQAFQPRVQLLHDRRVSVVLEEKRERKEKSLVDTNLKQQEGISGRGRHTQIF
jgi:hypothetical protein